MNNEDAEVHFRWIGLIVNRIICSKDPDDQIPLLSLSFLGNFNNIPNFSKFKRPTFPITVDQLSDGRFYGIILYTLFSSKKTNSNPNLTKVYDILHENKSNKNQSIIEDSQIDKDFDSILNTLSNNGYRPRKPCDSTGLNAKDVEHHVNLIRLIEFYVLDRSLRVDLLTSDLRRLPQSFFSFQKNSRIDRLEDAISLWLSKFHCNPYFTKAAKLGNSSYENDNQKIKKQFKLHLNDQQYCIQIDTSRYSKIAACLAKVYPDQINKNEIKEGLDEEEIKTNRDLSISILNELHAFIVDDFPCDEQLFLLFISDFFYATRDSSRNFVDRLNTIRPQQSFVPRYQPLLIHNYQIARPQVLSVCTFSKKPLPNQNKNGVHIDLFVSKSSLVNRSRTQPKIVKPKFEQAPLPPLQSPPKPISAVFKDKAHKKASNKKKSASKVEKNASKPQENIEEIEDEATDENQGQTIEEQADDLTLTDNSQEEAKIAEVVEKKPMKKYALEFPEIEILVKRLCEKFPNEHNHFIDLYDIFMKVMQEATDANSPVVPQIFKRAQSTFLLLLEGEKIDYDFETMLSSMINKK